MITVTQFLKGQWCGAIMVSLNIRLAHEEHYAYLFIKHAGTLPEVEELVVSSDDSVGE